MEVIVWIIKDMILQVLDNESYVDTSNGLFGIGGRSTKTTSNQYVQETS